MPNQSAKFVSAVFAGVLAGASFVPVSNNSARAEDSCLAAPNGQTPAGSHWRYRVERGTKRHCWYLREEGDAHAQSAAVTSSPPPAPAKPTPPKAEPAMQGSVANARAELPWPQQSAAPDTPAPAAQAPVAMAPANNAPSNDNSQPVTSAAPANDANASQASMASRWPDQMASASDDPAPDADSPNTTTTQPDATSAAPPPAAAAVPLAAADTPPASGKPPGSMQMLLMIMVAALALAGLVGGAILKFGGRRRDDDEFDVDRRPAWDIDHREHPLRYPAAPSPAVAPQRSNPPQRPNVARPRELRTVEPEDAIKEMLARLARSAQT